MFSGGGRSASSDQSNRSPLAIMCTVASNRSNASIATLTWPTQTFREFLRWKSVCTATTTSSKSILGFKRSTSISTRKPPPPGSRSIMWPSTCCSIINAISTAKLPAGNATDWFKTFTGCPTKTGGWGYASNATNRRTQI